MNAGNGRQVAAPTLTRPYDNTPLQVSGKGRRGRRPLRWGSEPGGYWQVRRNGEDCGRAIRESPLRLQRGVLNMPLQ